MGGEEVEGSMSVSLSVSRQEANLIAKQGQATNLMRQYERSGLDNSADELQEARRPIASLISKSEKAQQKLAPGTWQHTMVRDNLKALHIAFALMNKETNHTDNFTRDDLREALLAFAAMMSRTEKAQTKFSTGTSQRTLQRNRLKALHLAEALTKVELDKRNA